MKYVVCLSGGEASAISAIETVRRYGRENVILLNHDISPEVEHSDIKRFKNEISQYLGIPISYANMKGWEELTPIRVCRKARAWKVKNGDLLCTSRLKTEPFRRWLTKNFPSSPFQPREDITIIYGFGANERVRIQRRVGVMASLGYKTDYPLACWPKTITQIESIGIRRPSTYQLFRHANCFACLKSGKQQWYLTYCLFPHLFEEAKKAEDEIGYSVIKEGLWLEDLEATFSRMRCMGIVPSEKISPQRFWSEVSRIFKEPPGLFTPCECSF